VGRWLRTAAGLRLGVGIDDQPVASQPESSPAVEVTPTTLTQQLTGPFRDLIGHEDGEALSGSRPSVTSPGHEGRRPSWVDNAGGYDLEDERFVWALDD